MRNIRYLECSMYSQPQEHQLPPIATLDEMAAIVKMSKGSLAGVWKTWPHFYVGTGTNAKGARFIPTDVIAYLYQSGGYDVRFSVSDEKRTQIQSGSLSQRSSSSHKTRVYDKKRGTPMGANGNQKAYYENPDRHQLRLCG